MIKNGRSPKGTTTMSESRIGGTSRMVAQTRIELVTPRSSGECSTN
ncbi:MAG: hypothetical protein PeribacterA2_0396 [Candidatus Peribacter riflensis]|uniref:Uncharacterized protein n=1 Tax=Candidatus Peribacter riflensis TaxID=1735162 RepID=A0A0S1SLX2_9BACT|nr:MAG: hypothetical protein PeribacterA2_0396 [Candidatus Peribacter riflensis]ALM10884.1 MAG: hypothetical protein PeribacterB2_0396 [Candidatus Peribacter riflensis]ALM11986.1 MAG: hypothetical protein PeribacterC2_0395 [Candidatus Peribacter riflensis]ALM13089.1 MAG: hypothetical protein PeribacterD1_0396 [Candidatus Peribacter riflensis]ALM14189.1 MAG: hypothetical protein PeribacterD2_0395 [Candidatus Peribacter riflensis]